MTTNSVVMKNDEIQNSIVNVITNNTSLNDIDASLMCFSIDSSHFCSVLEGIERGLFKTKKRHRKQLKIYIKVRNEDFQPHDCTFNVARFVNSLETCDINDFMVIWKFKHKKDDETNSIWLHSKVSRSETEKKSQFIITNRNCKINGYYSSFVLDK
eukprot:305138_1